MRRVIRTAAAVTAGLAAATVLSTGAAEARPADYSVPAVAFRWVDPGPINFIVLNRP
uniref:hypothetical protein n=1 Tax=Streptomyces sp. SAT1 TaxID=1849967 RepID=UPI00144A7802|nr:hypothetical protein [Streptomyces sp. SAT1]